MTRFILASQAKRLSEEMFALPRPLAVRKPGEVTSSLCATLQDLRGDWWVRLADERMVRVHEKADLRGIAVLVWPLIEAKILAGNTLEILQGRLDAGRGGYVNVFEALPDEIKAGALTEKQMIEEGRLEVPGLL